MNTQFDLNVRTLTWNHDSRGLFDFESKNVFKKTYRARPTTESYVINRMGSEVGMQMSSTAVEKVPFSFQAPVSCDGSLSPLRQPSDVDSRTEAKTLVRVFYESGQYWIDHPERVHDSSKTLWLVIRQSKYPCALASGDMLKMGRYKIRIKEAVTESEQPQVGKSKRFSIASTDSYDADTQDSIESPADLCEEDAPPTLGRRASHPLVDIQGVEVCRICYDSGEDNNPLIAPCKCSGSMQYVHLKCLRKWMDGRLSVNNGSDQTHESGATTVSYFWRNLDCELCKVSYPTSVECPSASNVNEVEWVDLYELPKPEKPYIVLESNIRVPATASGSSSAGVPGVTFQKGLHIMSLSKARPSVVVGRGHEADVRINDISVSRFHAIIRLVQVNASGNGGLKKQQIVIEDRGSKFGSLVAVKGPIPLEPGVPVSIQSGRTITTITVKKPNLLSTIIPLCFGGSARAAAASGLQSASVLAAAAHPELINESSPSVDLKQALHTGSTQVAGQSAVPPPTSTAAGERTLMARPSVASTALRRASEALSMVQLDEAAYEHNHP